MTIRGGGGPRDDRPAGQERRPMARRLDGGAGQPARGSTRERRAGTVTAYEIARQRPRAGVGGLLRFAIVQERGRIAVPAGLRLRAEGELAVGTGRQALE